MAELLFEILTEEIPARFAADAEARFKDIADKGFRKAGILFAQVAVYTTPRRLTLVATGIPLKTDAKTDVVKGPNIKAPLKAVEGFLKKTGLSKEELVQETLGKNTFWMAHIKIPARDVAPLLSEVFLQILHTFTWPQTMHWGQAPHDVSRRFHWVRPIRGILALFDGALVELSLSTGNGPLQSTHTTRGHRFAGGNTSQDVPFSVSSFKDYEEKLQAHNVVLRRSKRRAIIMEAFKALAQKGTYALEGDVAPGGLIEEVSCLCENPFLVLAPLAAVAKTLPAFVPSLVLRHHMKAFVLQNKEGALQDVFAFVANIKPADGGKTIAQGLQAVATARLEDAAYFVDRDQKDGIKTMRARLKNRTFFDNLGTLADKTERMESLAKALWPSDTNLLTAAMFAKADLTSHMVGEFPELQGRMGGVYAQNAGFENEVADAICGHYWPDGVDENRDTTPSPCALKLALLDRIDSLYGFFACGLRPSGSKDPLALRRLGNGVMATLHALNVPGFDMESALKSVGAFYIKQGYTSTKDAKGVVRDLLSFLEERLVFFLTKKHGVAEKLLAFSKGIGLSHKGKLAACMYETLALSMRLQDKSFKDSFEKILSTFKRVHHIVAGVQPQKKSGLPENVDESLLLDAAEKNLWQALKPLLAQDSQKRNIAQLLALISPIDSFFEDVMIMAKDSRIQHNRVLLLEHVVAFANHFGRWQALI